MTHLKCLPAACLLALSACATSTGAPKLVVPKAPATLAAPADQVLTAELKAIGVQIYTCAVVKDKPGVFEWAFKAPEATLADASGKIVGKHYGGPTWENNDGSMVIGEVRARENSTEAGAIPWLLLNAKSKSGSGMFGKTQSIQRLDTAGGTAPAAATCTGTRLNEMARVSYTATYYFYSPRE